MTEILRKSNEWKESLKEKIKNPQKVADTAWPIVANMIQGTALDPIWVWGGSFWWGQKDGKQA